ncbi:Sec-independent protein translocase protein TatB [Porticoccaceae bacterium]|jgi:sec-independent protein translocase protein TatB|nr:Sec-independent protein translocase protein TatB [Porticoccaceae bacterium]MDA9352786.1 Sec-independent protein translocase protein TatB [Porticoccaceae bacterium]MDB4076768.1 Sec-independent protein translocase protein TatB [Porticoccaceae bacterium]MDB9952181.1 Sec-independent protein translocase protein TatB [Porticoccaceae bacterium]
MFDIGFSELLIIAVITLIVMGPERLPETVRTISLWLGRMKQMFSSARQELENEVGMDDIRRQLHNEKIMRDLNETKDELETSFTETKAALNKELSDTKADLDKELSEDLDRDLRAETPDALTAAPTKDKPND